LIKEGKIQEIDGISVWVADMFYYCKINNNKWQKELHFFGKQKGVQAL
jgi:hypothetical protein